MKLSTGDMSHALQWLRAHNFDTDVQESLSEFCDIDLLSLTKDDAKELVGVKNGIRLFHLIQRSSIADNGASLWFQIHGTREDPYSTAQEVSVSPHASVSSLSKIIVESKCFPEITNRSDICFFSIASSSSSSSLLASLPDADGKQPSLSLLRTNRLDNRIPVSTVVELLCASSSSSSSSSSSLSMSPSAVSTPILWIVLRSNTVSSIANSISNSIMTSPWSTVNPSPRSTSTSTPTSMTPVTNSRATSIASVWGDVSRQISPSANNTGSKTKENDTGSGNGDENNSEDGQSGEFVQVMSASQRRRMRKKQHGSTKNSPVEHKRAKRKNNNSSKSNNNSNSNNNSDSCSNSSCTSHENSSMNIHHNRHRNHTNDRTTSTNTKTSELQHEQVGSIHNTTPTNNDHDHDHDHDNDNDDDTAKCHADSGSAEHGKGPAANTEEENKSACEAGTSIPHGVDSTSTTKSKTKKKKRKKKGKKGQSKGNGNCGGANTQKKNQGGADAADVEFDGTSLANQEKPTSATANTDKTTTSTSTSPAPSPASVSATAPTNLPLALMRATAEGNLTQVQALIKQGANPHIVDIDKQETLLHKAVDKGHIKVAAYLMSLVQRKKTETNASNDSNSNNGRKKNNKKKRQKQKNGTAASGGSGGDGSNSSTASTDCDDADKDPTAINPLTGLPYALERVFDVNQLNAKRAAPLHLAAYNGDLEMVKLLVKEGRANISVVNTKSGDTALHAAALGDSLCVFRYLVEECKADMLQTDRENNTVLHFACIGGSLSITQYILSKVLGEGNDSDIGRSNNGGVRNDNSNGNNHGNQSGNSNGERQSQRFDVNVLNRQGRSSLHCAAMNGKDIQIVKYLVEEAHADMTIEDADQCNCVKVAALSNQFAILKYLIRMHGLLDTRPLHIELRHLTKLSVVPRFVETCFVCHKHPSKLAGNNGKEKKECMQCAQCFKRQYCSKECQKNDWKEHKSRCN